MNTEQIAKPCVRCKETKPLDEFANKSNEKQGKMAACRECERKRKAKYRKAHPEKGKEYNKAYKEKNRDKFRIYEKAYREKCKAESKKLSQSPYDSLGSRRRRLKNVFGIAIEEYDHILKIQGNVCAICKNPEVVKNRHVGSKGISRKT